MGIDSHQTPDAGFLGVLREPSAFLPLVMSLAALSLVLGHVAVYGVVRSEDEGTAAHLFQLLMVAQLPVIAFFAAKWLPRRPLSALAVLTLQFGAVVAAFTPIYLLEL